MSLSVHVGQDAFACRDNAAAASLSVSVELKKSFRPISKFCNNLIEKNLKLKLT